MREFFYPSNIAVFGVADSPRNLGRNIIRNCDQMGYKGEIFAIGREGGSLGGREIITDAETLPEGIDLAVILVPAAVVPNTLDICGRKGIRHAVISTAGYREFREEDNQAEKDLLEVTKRHGIRFIGPNCIGVMCTNSGLCTPFNPMEPKNRKKGTISIIAQSGGVATQCSTYFDDEYLGFSKIISAGNKLDLDEVDFIQYLEGDEDTEQIHLYLESIDDGRRLMEVARKSSKPIVMFKSNVSNTASEIAMSHTAALSNDDRVVDAALKQAGIVRVKDIHDMTVCAKALRLRPLRGNRLVAMSLSGGFSVILGDTCEEHGFECPPLPESLIRKIEGYRRAGVIRMSNPMDFGDVHDARAISLTIEACLALDDIDGMAFCVVYNPEASRMFGSAVDLRETVQEFLKALSQKYDKPIALSLFAERRYIDDFKKTGIYPVFNDPVESIRALHMLRQYWRTRITGGKNEDNPRRVSTG